MSDILSSSSARQLGAEVLEGLIETLEAHPFMAARLAGALGLRSSPPHPTETAKRMTVAEYARHARISERTVRYYVAEGMVEGRDFHRDGRKGRRVVIHVDEADTWVASRSLRTPDRTVEDARAQEDLSRNEVLRRRAHVALKKAGLKT